MNDVEIGHLFAVAVALLLLYLLYRAFATKEGWSEIFQEIRTRPMALVVTLWLVISVTVFFVSLAAPALGEIELGNTGTTVFTASLYSMIAAFVVSFFADKL